jgi:cell division septation protein DedD
LQQREVGTRQKAAARGLRYRVIVSAGRRADRVRSLFPNAFTTYSGGQAVLQVGAFGDRANAEEAAQILDSNGLNGMIETLDN